MKTSTGCGNQSTRWKPLILCYASYKKIRFRGVKRHF